MIGIYIHIPFCERKCPYCDFYSLPCSSDTRELYANKLVENIQRYKGSNIKADTIYFGGGTPSLLTSQQIKKIITAIYESFEIINPEITIEANPSSANAQWLTDIHSLGINRISFGIQSADDKELAFLGRLHNFSTAQQTLENAVNAGFNNISADIMIGLPFKTPEKIEKNLEKFVKLPVNHISAYMLKIEKGTPFYKMGIKNNLPDDDTTADIYLQTVDFLQNHGFMQYEISNFAKDEKISRHNTKYWKCSEYLGFGTSAHSFFGGKRFFCPNNLEKFLASEIQPEITEDNSPDKTEEYIMLGLRLVEGINTDNICEKNFADKIMSKAEFFQQYKLCVVDGKNIHLTPEGFLVSNEIIEEFLRLRD